MAENENHIAVAIPDASTTAPSSEELDVATSLAEDLGAVVSDNEPISTYAILTEEEPEEEERMQASDFDGTIFANSEGIFACIACDKTYRSRNHLRRHISVAHLKIKRFPCTICGKRFASSQPLRVHIRTHTGEKPHVCAECGKAFSDPSALRNHEKMHNRRLGVMCNMCGRYLSTDGSMRNHMKKHKEHGHDSAMFSFPCPECNLNFCSEEDLRCHISAHENERAFECQECPRKYSSMKALRYHQRTHTGEKSYECTECGEDFNSAKSLKVHYAVHESPSSKPKYNCDQCGKNYSVEKSLNFHRCEGSFPCWVCNTMFASYDELEEHKSTHSVEDLRKHVCNVCERRFSKAKILENHQCKILFVVDFEEPAKNALKSEAVDQDESEVLMVAEPWVIEERQEFRIDRCKFIATHGEADGAESDIKELISAVEPMEVTEGNHDVSVEEILTIEPRGPESDEDEGTALSIDENLLAKDTPEVEKKAIAPVPEKLEMSPTCILDKSCQKCGSDIDKEVGDSQSGSPTTHICHGKRKYPNSKKVLPLSKALSLKSKSPSPKKKAKVELS